MDVNVNLPFLGIARLGMHDEKWMYLEGHFQLSIHKITQQTSRHIYNLLWMTQKMIKCQFHNLSVYLSQ